MRSLLLDVIMTVARLIKHIHYKVVNDTQRYQDTSAAAEAKYRQMNEYRELLNRLVLYLDLLKTSISNSSGKADLPMFGSDDVRGGVLDSETNLLQRVIEVSNECRKIQIEVA